MTLEEAFRTYEEIYRCVHSDIEFYFRPLTRKEFEVLLSISADGFEFEDNVCLQCVISPENFDYKHCKAGIPAMVCLTILEISGIGDTNFSVSMLEQARELIRSDFDRQMDSVIMMAFPQYRQDELENWTRKKLFMMYAQAEWTLEIRGLTLGTQIGNQNNTSAPGLPPPPQPPRF